jgi:hypothetical protein
MVTVGHSENVIAVEVTNEPFFTLLLCVGMSCNRLICEERGRSHLTERTTRESRYLRSAKRHRCITWIFFKECGTIKGIVDDQQWRLPFKSDGAGELYARALWSDLGHLGHLGHLGLGMYARSRGRNMPRLVTHESRKCLTRHL